MGSLGTPQCIWWCKGCRTQRGKLNSSADLFGIRSIPLSHCRELRKFESAGQQTGLLNCRWAHMFCFHHSDPSRSSRGSLGKPPHRCWSSCPHTRQSQQGKRPRTPASSCRRRARKDTRARMCCCHHKHMSTMGKFLHSFGSNSPHSSPMGSQQGRKYWV